MEKNHSFFIDSLVDKEWDSFKFHKDDAVKMEENIRRLLEKCVKAFINNENDIIKFDDVFDHYMLTDNTEPRSEILLDFTEYIDGKYSKYASKVNDIHHARSNYEDAFLKGKKKINSYKIYYAIILTLLVIKEDSIVNKKLFYTYLFDNLGIPDFLRNDSFLCEKNNIYDIEFWNEKGIILLVMIYLQLLFESKTKRSFEAYKERCKVNLCKKLKNSYSRNGKEECTQNIVDVLTNLKKDYSGKLVYRNDIEKDIGGVKSLFFLGNRRIVNEVTFVMYTGSSFLNVISAEKGVSDDRLVSIEPALLEFLNSGGKINIILTDPFSAGADEAVFSKKLGNINDQGTKTPFSLSYELMRKVNRKFTNLNIRYTNISLPYSLMKVDFCTDYRKFNYVKVDLYSFGLDTNRDRLSTITFEEGKPYSYTFLSDNIKYIMENAYDIDFSYKPEIMIIKKGDYEKEGIMNRVYFTGQRKFDKERNNFVDNQLSNIEFGVSIYKNEYEDKLHYHRTTNEHYMVIEGKQKIVDLNTKKVYVAEAGDVVFIPKLTPHITKESANTKIVFAKSPYSKADGQDKEVILKSNYIEELLGENSKKNDK